MIGNRKSLLKKAVQLLNAGDANKAYHPLQAILNASREANDVEGEATALHLMGVAAHDQGRLEEAQMLLQRSLSLKQRAGDASGEMASYHQLGIIAQDRGRYEEAREYFQRSLMVSQQLGDRRGAFIEPTGEHSAAI